MAAATLSELKGIREDTASMSQLLRDKLTEESMVPAPLDDAQPIEEGTNWVTEVRSSVEVPEDFFADLMAFQYLQLTLTVVLVVAVLLNFGANLWQCFARNIRS